MPLSQLWAELPPEFLIFHTLLSLMMGSFLNVVAHRLPIMLERNWRREASEILQAEAGTRVGVQEEQLTGTLERKAEEEKAFNLAWPGSHCPSCKNPIRWWRNIPVFSWLWLRGRCADCGERVPVRYLLMEASCALAGIGCYLLFEPDYLTVLALSGFCWVLIALAIIDVETGYLPDELTLSMLWGGILYNLYRQNIPLPDAVLGAVAGYGVLWLMANGFKLIRGVDGMGGGDMKMLAMIGAWWGWAVLPSALLVACAVTLVYAGWSELSGRSARILRFGPGLSLGGFWALFSHYYPMPGLWEFIIPIPIGGG